MKKLRYVLILTILLALVPTIHAQSADAEITLTAIYQEAELVTLDLAATSEISSLDPAVASDSVSLTPIENLFLGLTDVDPFTGEIVPELATSWEISEDGKIWTFHLRDDVLWYHYNPATDSAEAVRPVVAQDFVYGIKRACDPRLGGYYGTIAARVIAGCEKVNGAPDSDVTDALVFGDTIKVSAPDDETVVVELQFAAGYFFSMTSMWMLRATPHETIDEFGEDWTLAGNIVTNGAYFLQENTRGIRRSFVRNNQFNVDLGHGGNIDHVTYTLIEDGSTTFALFQDSQIDFIDRVNPPEPVQIIRSSDYLEQFHLVYEPTVFYFGFAHDIPPFDNVHVRRAFSAIIDRNIFIEQILQTRGVPMIHFTPPGMNHAPPVNEVGVGFDPAYAQDQLALAGYPNCERFPEITIETYSTAGSWAEFWASAAEEHLGCTPDFITVENLKFNISPQTAPDAPTPDRPNAWTAGWGPDYGDAHNWIRDVLACDAYNNFLRPCTEIDDLIEAAGRSNDPFERDALYLEIEEAFFGEDGEFPIAPIYMRAGYALRKLWYTGAFDTDGIYGGAHWDAYSVDMMAKLAARNGE